MPNDQLNQAIQLVQQGQDAQAQIILQALIQANQQDLEAWSWYVKSCRTPEKRLVALELCLRFNPDNRQIMEAIQKLREKVSAQPIPTRDFDRAPGGLVYTQEPSPYAMAETPKTVNQMEVGSEPVKFMGLDDVTSRPLMWYDVWWMAFTQPKVDFYTALLQDPLANPMRAYWWVFLASIITGLVSLVNPSMIEILNELANVPDGETISIALAVILIVLVPIGAAISVLWLMLSAVFYTLLAKAFGGTGNFSRTVYLMAAFNAPLSIISGILSIIPCINILALLLSFYAFRLHVAAVQAAHRLNGGRATLVVFISVFISVVVIFLISGVVGMILGQALTERLPEIQRILENAR